MATTNEQALTTARLAVLAELEELLDLVQTDGSIHDLDQYEPGTLGSPSAETLLWLLRRADAASELLDACKLAHKELIALQ